MIDRRNSRHTFSSTIPRSFALAEDLEEARLVQIGLMMPRMVSFAGQIYETIGCLSSWRTCRSEMVRSELLINLEDHGSGVKTGAARSAGKSLPEIRDHEENMSKGEIREKAIVEFEELSAPGERGSLVVPGR